MTPDQTAALIAELRAAEAKMTPGPWEYERDHDGDSMGWIVSGSRLLLKVLGDSAEQEDNADGSILFRNSILSLCSAAEHYKREAERLQAELAEARNGLKLAIGVRSNRPWNEVPESDVDSYVTRVAELAALQNGMLPTGG